MGAATENARTERRERDAEKIRSCMMRDGFNDGADASENRKMFAESGCATET